MASKQSFFGQLDARFKASRAERSRTATYLYNHYGEPFQALDDKNAYWFDDYSKRANFTGFKSYRDFSDDLTCFILKPYIFGALAAYELQKFMLCIPAALAQVIKLSPTGFANKMLDMGEAFIEGLLLNAYATLELFMQVGSLAVRLYLTGLECLGFNCSEAKSADVEEAVHFSCSV